MDIQIGNHIKLKKQHPCGTNEWEVLRVGMDIRLCCTGCEHMLLLPRREVEKNYRSLLSRST